MSEKKRILFVGPGWSGHNNQLISLAEELSARKYEVSYATSAPFRERIESKGVKFYLWDPDSIISDADLLARYHGHFDRVALNPNLIHQDVLLFDLLADMYPTTYDLLEKIFDTCSPQLVVGDAYTIPAVDLAYKRGIPCVVQAISLEDHALTGPGHPHYATGYCLEMSLAERVSNFLYPYRVDWALRRPLSKLERYRNKLGFNLDYRVPFNASIILAPTTFGFELARPVPSNVLLVGPIFPREIEPLSDSLQCWLDESGAGGGALYVSFGTLAYLSRQTLSSLFKALVDIDIQILLSLREGLRADVGGLPQNFRVESYVPQRAVLAHPAVRAFISHGGINSVMESLYFGKPMLCTPVNGDQPYNAARIVDSGAGLKLPLGKFDPNEIRQKVQRLIREDTFRNAAQEISIIQQAYRGRERTADLLEAFLKVGVKRFIAKPNKLFVR